MSVSKNNIKDNKVIEKRTITISSKRQVTIPVKYYEALGFKKELTCIYANNMLILTPTQNEEPAFAEEILSDLIEQGYSGEDLLREFKKINRKIRPAVEKIIAEADKIAEESLAYDYIDPTDQVFGDSETED